VSGLVTILGQIRRFEPVPGLMFSGSNASASTPILGKGIQIYITLSKVWITSDSVGLHSLSSIEANMLKVVYER